MIKSLEEQAELITGSFSYRSGYQGVKDAYIAGAEWANARICDFLKERENETITKNLIEDVLKLF